MIDSLRERFLSRVKAPKPEQAVDINTLLQRLEEGTPLSIELLSFGIGAIPGCTNTLRSLSREPLLMKYMEERDFPLVVHQADKVKVTLEYFRSEDERLGPGLTMRIYDQTMGGKREMQVDATKHYLRIRVPIDLNEDYLKERFPDDVNKDYIGTKVPESKKKDIRIYKIEMADQFLREKGFDPPWITRPIRVKKLNQTYAAQETLRLCLEVSSFSRTDPKDSEEYPVERSVRKARGLPLGPEKNIHKRVFKKREFRKAIAEAIRKEEVLRQ